MQQTTGSIFTSPSFCSMLSMFTPVEIFKTSKIQLHRASRKASYIPEEPRESHANRHEIFKCGIDQERTRRSRALYASPLGMLNKLMTVFSYQRVQRSSVSNH